MFSIGRPAVTANIIYLYILPQKQYMGWDPFDQNFRKSQSKTQWIGLVQSEKF